jgi:hypothetical protein
VHNIPEHKYEDDYRARRKNSCNSEVRKNSFIHIVKLFNFISFAKIVYKKNMLSSRIIPGKHLMEFEEFGI